MLRIKLFGVILLYRRVPVLTESRRRRRYVPSKRWELKAVPPVVITQKTRVIIHIENPKRCNSISKFYFISIWSSTCFGRHTAHHQEPKTALAASGFAYVEGCWTCSCWTLTASSNYTSNNLPLMQNQRMLVQF